VRVRVRVRGRGRGRVRVRGRVRGPLRAGGGLSRARLLLARHHTLVLETLLVRVRVRVRVEVRVLAHGGAWLGLKYSRRMVQVRVRVRVLETLLLAMQLLDALVLGARRVPVEQELLAQRGVERDTERGEHDELKRERGEGGAVE